MTVIPEDEYVPYDGEGTPEDMAPRRSVETDPLRNIMGQVADLRRALEVLQRTSSLRNASISGGEGLRVLDDDGTLQAQISPDRTITVFDLSGVPVVRMGEMLETGPEPFGIEVRVAEGSWIQLGSQSVSWVNVGDKPATFPASPHTHPGGEVTSAVANATNATTAVTAAAAAQADGSQYGWTNTVAGTTFYQVWVGNDGGFHFGRNVSSIQYKENVRDLPAGTDPRRVLKLRPVRYDRKPTTGHLDPGVEGPVPQYPGAKDEFGLIAEETYQFVPEIVTRFNGKIDGIRYELLPVAMIPVLQVHDQELADLRRENEMIKAELRKMGGTI